jgi:preprotein translocase subunit YajC
MWISTALAQDGGAGGGGMIVQLLPLILIFVVFYFLLIRPQQKKLKDHREMVANLRRGDKVVTGGGLYATVSKVEDDATLILEIAPNVRVKAARNTITELAAKPEPRKNADNDEKPVKEQ